MYIIFFKHCSKGKRNNHKNPLPTNINFFDKSKNNKTNIEFYQIFNFILFYLTLILLPKPIISGYIELKVNHRGEQQILSDEFTGTPPSKYFVDNIEVSINEKRIQIESESSTIKLEWSGTITDFSSMFSNLENITEIKIDHLLGKNNNFSFTFSNCINLKIFSIDVNYHMDYAIIDMRGMFYNCSSLDSFSFYNLYLDYYNYQASECLTLIINGTERTECFPVTRKGYNDINMSYMFYNCTSLKTIDKDSKTFQKISDMNNMFYNCYSLEYINLKNFKTDNLNINLSYIFYNCYSLTSITFSSTANSFGVKEMKYMFYNCYRLSELNLKSFRKDSSTNRYDMSYLFYNCYSLTSIEKPNNYFPVSDTREMFYNCKELTSYNFNPSSASININMTKMFYNCNNLNSITLSIGSGNSYFEPNDMSSMFYNCRLLTSLDLNKFKTNKVQYMNYMLYNCINLYDFKKLRNKFNNSLITDMRGLFQNCQSLITLDLTNFYTPNVTIMWDMFNGCSNLINLIIPNFDTSEVTDMQSMFQGCKNLLYLNLNHFNTTNIQYMNKMFQDCENLEELNISHLFSNSSSSMYRMFYNCKKLKYLNIFNLVEDAQSITEMFEGISDNFILCIKDKENIPNIYDLISDKITRDCSSDCYGIGYERNITQNQKRCCPLYEYENECYNNCPSKTKIQDSTNICKYFSCDNYYNYEQNDCIDNITYGYYLNDSNAKTIDKCHEDCETCYSGPDENSTNCLICKENKPYVYLGNCYTSCRKGYFNDSNGAKACLCHKTKCKECSRESLKHNLCVSCNNNEEYYEKFNDEKNLSNFIFRDCFKNPEEYFLNKTQKKYMLCYPSCKYCASFTSNKEHHFCKECNEDNNLSILDEDNSPYMNCYPECKFNYYFNKSDYDNYTCTESINCPESYPLLLENTKQCVESCQNLSMWEFRHTCFKQCPYDSKNYTNKTGFYCNASCPFESPFEMVKTQYCVSNCTIMERNNGLCFTNYDGDKFNEVQDMVLIDFKDNLIDGFNFSFITNEQYLIHKEKNYIYEILSSKMKYKYNDSKIKEITILDLGECETKLKEYYRINDNESLYIFKIDAFVPGKTGPKVEYEIYYPLNSINLNLLDLSMCEGKKINISYPIEFSEDELHLYNTSSPYYSDICYTYTNKKGTDVTLNDRLYEYISNNKSICEENCIFSGYDKDIGRVNCTCEIKFSISPISQIKVDKNQLYKYIDLRQMVNFKVMICFNLLFSIEGIITNIGFYSFFPTLISYIIAIFILTLIEYEKIIEQIDEIFLAKQILKYYKIKKVMESEKEKDKLKKLSVNKLIHKKRANLTSDNTSLNSMVEKYFDKYINDKNDLIEINQDSEEKTKNINGNSGPYQINNIIKDDKILFNRQNTEKKSDLGDKILIEKSHVYNLFKIKKSELNEEHKIKIVLILKYNDNELNALEYEEAYKYDKRNFKQYYLSLLFTKHIIFQIFNKRDYNVYSIKVLLVFFNFSACYAVNALFFNDDTMHQIYEDEGVFNFIYQLPQIAYSTLISYFIDNITSYLALSEDNIINLKQDEDLTKLNARIRIFKKTLMIKFKSFFVVNIILILLFWYYLGCFCAVYKNTQYHLLKDTLVSMGIGYITPFGTNILIALIRIHSLKKYTRGNRTLFKLSLLLQKFL